LLRPEGLKNEENGSNFDAGRFLKSADGSIAGNIRLFQTIPRFSISLSSGYEKVSQAAYTVCRGFR